MEAPAETAAPTEAPEWPKTIVDTPIGLDIGGEKPAEIAVSIMAEVLAARNGGTCRSMSEILRDSVFPL